MMHRKQDESDFSSNQAFLANPRICSQAGWAQRTKLSTHIDIAMLPSLNLLLVRIHGFLKFETKMIK